MSPPPRVVKLNEAELEFLTGTSDAARGSRMLVEQGVQLCCVSLGADGAYFDNGTACGHVPALDVTVVDTTGSGDAFVAGLAAQVVPVGQAAASAGRGRAAPTWCALPMSAAGWLLRSRAP